MSAVRPVNTGKMQDLIFKAAKTADYWSGITVLWGIGLINSISAVGISVSYFK